MALADHTVHLEEGDAVSGDGGVNAFARTVKFDLSELLGVAVGLTAHQNAHFTVLNGHGKTVDAEHTLVLGVEEQAALGVLGEVETGAAEGGYKGAGDGGNRLKSGREQLAVDILIDLPADQKPLDVGIQRTAAAHTLELFGGLDKTEISHV